MQGLRKYHQHYTEREQCLARSVSTASGNLLLPAPLTLNGRVVTLGLPGSRQSVQLRKHINKRKKREEATSNSQVVTVDCK